MKEKIGRGGKGPLLPPRKRKEVRIGRKKTFGRDHIESGKRNYHYSH